MVSGFMAGVTLGQKLVSMSKNPPTKFSRLQYARQAAYKRMIARQSQPQTEIPIVKSNSFKSQGQGRGQCSGRNQNFYNDDFIFTPEGQGELLRMVKNNFSEFNSWIKKISGGFLDLNMSLALIFIVRGIRKLILEKQTPNAWQMIWWAMSILRGWKAV